MASIHIFFTILILQTLFSMLIQIQCCKNLWQTLFICKPCRKLFQINVKDTFVIGGLRLIFVGFLEILLCTYIGFGIFKLGDQMTNIDILTGVVVVLYTICLIVFCAIMTWFIIFKSRPLIEFKSVRDQLEFLKVIRIIVSEQHKSNKSLSKIG